MQVAGLKITKINEVESGTSKAGKAWKKLTFVGETQEQYNNLYAFELFGEEKVDSFVKYNNVLMLLARSIHKMCDRIMILLWLDSESVAPLMIFNHPWLHFGKGSTVQRNINISEMIWNIF